MGGKTAIAAGLFTGVLAGGVVLAGILFLVPVVPAESGPSAGASASPVPASTAPSPAPSASASPDGSPSTAPSASGPPSSSPSSSPSASPGDGETGFGVGEPAPALLVPRLGGGEIDLAALRGKPVWVNFMATWCPPCRDELPIMAGFAARYEDTGLVVIVVDVREDEAAMDAFATALGITFPVGMDADGAAQARWGAYALPVHYWVDADGIVRDGALGGIGPDVMAAGLRTVLPGVEVTP